MNDPDLYVGREQTLVKHYILSQDILSPDLCNSQPQGCRGLQGRGKASDGGHGKSEGRRPAAAAGTEEPSEGAIRQRGEIRVKPVWRSAGSLLDASERWSSAFASGSTDYVVRRCLGLGIGETACLGPRSEGMDQGLGKEGPPSRSGKETGTTCAAPGRGQPLGLGGASVNSPRVRTLAEPVARPLCLGLDVALTGHLRQLTLPVFLPYSLDRVSA